MRIRRYPWFVRLLVLAAVLEPLMGPPETVGAQTLPPMVLKDFAAATIPLGGTTTVTFHISNPNAAPTTLTGVNFTDTLPAGLVVATPNNKDGFCTGGSTAVVTADSGGSTIRFSSGTLVGSQGCQFHVDVTGTTGGTKVNTVTVNSTNGGTGNTATAVLTVGPTPTSTPTSTVTSTPTSTPTATRTPTVTPTPIPGDYHPDGFVDIRDYGVWRQHFGAMNAGNPADGDHNNFVDIRDYGIWRQHFGEGTPAGRRGGGPQPAGRLPAPGSGAVLRAEDAGLAVTVIPLVGGLLGLGGLVEWRRRRPPSDRE
jgi:hypothetical protein